MKRNFTMTKIMIAIVGLTLTSCSSWHYNNPRVSVDKQKTIYAEPAMDAPIEQIKASDENVAGENKTENKTIGQVTTLSNPVTKPSILRSADKKLPAVANTSLEKTKPAFDIFADHFKKKGETVNKTKHIEKAAAGGWVRIMIILFVIGFILLLMGIFFSVFLFGGFWWLFYGFGALLILAGFVVLILGLLGLI